MEEINKANMPKTKKKGKLSTIFLVIIFVIGLSLLLYPSVSDYWNSFHASRAISSYADVLSGMDPELKESELQAAREYNDRLAARGDGRWVMDEAAKAEYESLVNVAGTGIMGYIEIPTIHLNLPVYHGTDEATLQNGVGHLEGTSLPVGGIGTHCVLSGHRGLPSAKLFTNLDRLEVGDLFRLTILDEMLTYEVDQILIVEPEDVTGLEIDPNEEYCTLVTCTPYGINTHRMLVRGHRTTNEGGDFAGRADATKMEPIMVAPFIAVPILLFLLAALIIRSRKR